MMQKYEKKRKVNLSYQFEHEFLLLGDNHPEKPIMITSRMSEPRLLIQFEHEATSTGHDDVQLFS